MHALRRACRRRCWWLALWLFSGILVGCDGPAPVQRQSYVFGTLVEVSVAGQDAEHAGAAAENVLREFDRLHRTWHAWQPSALTAINDGLAQGQTLAITPELAAVLAMASRYAAQTDQLFNPAIGGLIAAWGFQADSVPPHIPSPETLRRWLQPAPRMSDLRIAETTLSSAKRNLRIDLGGFLKGYALDRARVLLHQQGVHNALINIGGNVLALGKNGKRAWRVVVRHPRKPGPFAMVELRDGEAIGTSGDYQRYFELVGKRYCHVIDPRTGAPATEVQAATVLIAAGAESGTMSDVASKPLFIVGPKGWREAARRMGVDHALLIDQAGVLHLTAAMAQRLELTDKTLLTVVE